MTDLNRAQRIQFIGSMDISNIGSMDIPIPMTVAENENPKLSEGVVLLSSVAMSWCLSSLTANIVNSVGIVILGGIVNSEYPPHII